MTEGDFRWLCSEHNILPAIALENEQVRKILKSDLGRNSVQAQMKINGILQTQF